MERNILTSAPLIGGNFLLTKIKKYVIIYIGGENTVLIDIDENNLEMLRVIRNECKDFMTRSNAYVNREGQITWFDSINKNVIKPYLFKYNDKVIGYGLIRIENSFLLSGGLISEYRGQGLGGILFQELIDKCSEFNDQKPIDLEVLKSNTRAYSLYKKLGFIEVDSDDKIIFMRKKEIKHDTFI